MNKERAIRQGFIFVISIVLLSFLAFAQTNQTTLPSEALKSLEAPPEFYESIPSTAYLYPNAGADPWTQVSWKEDYCNKTGMDFLVMIEPTACSPAVVRSDLLEEQDVPVLCRMTGVKINPLIQVPYIKSIVARVENKSNEIGFVNFLPARAALSYTATSNQKQASLEGVPTMNNLGYLWIQLKQQPVEEKMPESVKANMSVKITYDVARTYGVTENQFVLPLLSQDDWLSRYKEFGFWRGKGYLRLQEISGTNRAKVAVYTNPRSAPLKTVELREGVTPAAGSQDEIMLPGFYCGAGVRLKLEKITTPTTRARVLVNGNEMLLDEDEQILDSGCWIDEIVSSASYGGSVTIRCSGEPSRVLTIKDYEANVEFEDSDGKKSQTVSVGNNLTINKVGEKKSVYVGFMGKEYSQGGFTDFMILFYRGNNFGIIQDSDKQKIVSKIHDYVKSKRGETLDVKDMPDTLWITELQKMFEGQSYAKDLRFFVRKVGVKVNIPEIGVPFEILSVTGPEQVYYKKDVESLYKDAVQEWRNIAFAYSSKPSPEGTYYGIIAMRNAADLASSLHKTLDQAELLRELIDKYATSEESEVINEVENAREELRRAVSGAGERNAQLSRPNGNYDVELISIEKPGFGTKEAQVELNGTKSTVTVDDEIDGWTVTDIDETSVRFQNLSNINETIAIGSWKYLGSTKVQVLNTVLRREVKVTVLPFEKERTTETNFSVAIGIEKRAIKLSPEKTNELIGKLNKTITALEGVRDKLGKIVTVWKKACFAGATALWIKNFVTGLSGEAYARKLVMEPWAQICSDAGYRQEIGAKSISDCYRVKENEIDKDIDTVKSSLSRTNKFINDIKSKEGVVSKGGLLGLSQNVNTTKFMQEVEKNFPSELKGIDIVEEKELRRITDGDGRIELPNGEQFANIGEVYNKYPNIDKTQTAKILNNNISSTTIASHLTELHDSGRLFRDDVKDIVLNLDLYKQCSSKTSTEITNSALCSGALKGTYGELKYAAEQIQETSTLSAFSNIFGFNPTIARPKETQSTKAEVRIADDNFINKFNFGSFKKIARGERYSVISYLGVYYIAVVESAGSHKFTISRLYEIPKLPTSAAEVVTVTSMVEGTEKLEKLSKLGISDIEEIDPTLCNNNQIKQAATGEPAATIKFWESGAYQGFVAWMPLNVRDGWYMATTSYTGLEGAMIAWKENADINTFWICNVGTDGLPNFDHNSGPKGDDCCTLVSLVTGTVPEISGCLTPGCSSELVNKAKKCGAEAIKAFASGNRKISTSCGEFTLGKPPAARPAAQCEDYMSPTDCRIMYNLCDPVMCPASRCDYGGRMPVENVIQSGVVGSLMLCLPNFEDGKGVIVPVCITGVHAGLDSFIGILKSGRDCLQEQLKSGKTVGICDQIMSIYICEFFWKQLDPFLKAGLPSLAESLTTRGGGEYSLFSESWKQSLDAARYFTDYYGVQSFNAFKARSTGQIGTEICKKFASITYPTQAKFWDELSKPESYPQATAWFDEISMGTATPESHYKVFFYIWAGRDQGVYYSVFLRGSSQPGYYEVPEEYLVKDGFGYLSAGQYISMSPDFTAPSGYKEICIRINDKEWCDFTKVSTSFAINELQNYYLEDQLMEEVTSAKECVSGTPTIMPTATLNIQSYIESSLEPQIYKSGVARICSSRNPGEPIQQTERFRKIGYCDNKDIGCWLDLESVNRTVSDLKIRKDVINESIKRDLTYTINELNLSTPEDSSNALKNITPSILAVGNKVNKFIGEVRGKSLDELQKTTTKGYMESRIAEIDKEILPLINNVKEIRDKCARSDEKAMAWMEFAKLYDLRARLHAAPEVYKAEAEIKEAQEATCLSFANAQWKENCTKYEDDITDSVGKKDKDAHPNEKCCKPKVKEKLDVWPIDINEAEVVVCYDSRDPSASIINPVKTDNLIITDKSQTYHRLDEPIFSLKAIAGGEIIEVKKEKDQYRDNYGRKNTGLDLITITINHSGKFYSRVRGVMDTPHVQPGKGNHIYIEEGDVIAKVWTYGYAFQFWIYKENPVANPKAKGSNPFCYFSSDIQEVFKEKCEDNIKECQRYEAATGLFTTRPVSGFTISSCYGWRMHPINKNDTMHEGIDINAVEGDDVKAVASGTVNKTYVECKERCTIDASGNPSDACNCGGKAGNYVVIKHNDNLFTRYYHLKEVNVQVGNFVTAGQTIGTVGSTGSSTSDHLHFGVFKTDTIDESKHPLCFFSPGLVNQIRFTKNALDKADNFEINKKYGTGANYCLPNSTFCTEEIKGMVVQKVFGKCSDASRAEECKGMRDCWWDSIYSACKECPGKCEGEIDWSWFPATDKDDKVFRAKPDCEQNTCNLDCLWLESEPDKNNKCRSVTDENVRAKLDELAKGTASATDLNRLESLINEHRTSLTPVYSDTWLKIIQQLKLQAGPQQVFLVSGDKQPLDTENKLIENKNDVTICVVVKIGENYYSENIFNFRYEDSITHTTKRYKETDGTLNVKWYKIVPYYKPQYSGSSERYELPPFMAGNKDLLQYNQVLLDETTGCIDANRNVGTYWYRAEVSFDNGATWHSSLGKAATASDKAAYEKKYSEYGINFNKYSNRWNTLLEPAASEKFGISPKVHRISRKSNYSETICGTFGYSSNDRRCQFLSIVEAYKNVPFALGCVSCEYTFQSSPQACALFRIHPSQDFTSIECISLMKGALYQITKDDSYFESEVDFEKFISDYSTRAHPKQGNPVSFDNVFGGDGLTFGKGKQVEPGDLLFMWTPDEGYTHTFIVYDDSGNSPEKFDEDDKVVYTSLWCPADSTDLSVLKDKTQKRLYDGKLCYAPIGRYDSSENKFTLVKINDLKG